MLIIQEVGLCIMPTLFLLAKLKAQGMLNSPHLPHSCLTPLAMAATLIGTNRGDTGKSPDNSAQGRAGFQGEGVSWA
jgi:hypothetical protein